MSFQLTGLIATAPTPMHGDGSLWLEQIAPLVEHLIAANVAGLYVVGSTGEGPPRHGSFGSTLSNKQILVRLFSMD